MSLPKAFRINYSDLVTHGFTEGCQQCDHNAISKKSKAGLTHTAACRTRMLEALMSTPEGRARLEVCEGKVDRALADRIEKDDKPASEEVQPRPPGDPEPAAAGQDEVRPAKPSGLDPDDLAGASSARPTGRVSVDPAPRSEPEHATEMEDNISDKSDSEDADMGAVHGAESEEDVGVVYEDIEDDVMTVLLAQMGQSSKSYRREFKKASKHLVSEIYSPHPGSRTRSSRGGIVAWRQDSRSI